MVSRQKNSESAKPKRPPATTPRARENQLIRAAVDLAEKQILDGTVSATVHVHYLKLATERERLEREQLQYRNELLRAQKEALDSQRNVEELYGKAIEAMKRYSGRGGEVYEDPDFY